jgi:hypothetical protein
MKEAMDGRTLQEIVKILEDDAWNYSVFLASYEVPSMRPSLTADLIKAALGKEATLYSIEDIQSASVWPVVEEALLYAGELSAGPSTTALASEKLASLMDALKRQVDELIRTATKIEIFSLEEGHPAYPVFWDFALLFRTETSATVFIGSSSD